MCVQELGKKLYTGSGNVNKKTLAELQNKVIVVFTATGLGAIDAKKYHGTGGILGIRNLYDGGSTSPRITTGFSITARAALDMLIPERHVGSGERR